MICISEGFSRDGRRPLLVGESITRCPLKWDLLILHYKTLLGFLQVLTFMCNNVQFTTLKKGTPFSCVWLLSLHKEVIYFHVVCDVIRRTPALQSEGSLATMRAGCFGSPWGSATSNGILKSSSWDRMGSQWWGGTHRSKCLKSGLTFTNTCMKIKFWIRF